MYTTVPMEAQFFLLCVLAGAVTAFIYDLLRISRRMVKVSDFAVNVQDLLFFAVAAVILFIAAYLKNSGEIRWQAFLGGAAGIALYIVAVRNRLLNLSTAIMRVTVKAVNVVMRVLLFPVRMIFKMLRKPFSIVIWYTGNGVRRMRGAVRRGKLHLRLNLRTVFEMLRKK